VNVPEQPGELVTEFLPRRFAELLPAERVVQSRPSPRGVVVRVTDSGEWTLSVVAGALRVTPGAAPDAALQVSLRAADFATLVLEPLRGPVPEPSAAQLSALLGKLSRWDDETTELLRHVPGSLLVRVDDAGQVRPIAITPGGLVFSLEQGECTIDCPLGVLRDVASGRRSPLDALYAGELKLGGDVQLALALGGAFLG
jgi:SCP-2 sterol transfer family protein